MPLTVEEYFLAGREDELFKRTQHGEGRYTYKRAKRDFIQVDTSRGREEAYAKACLSRIGTIISSGIVNEKTDVNTIKRIEYKESIEQILICIEFVDNINFTGDFKKSYEDSKILMVRNLKILEEKIKKSPKSYEAFIDIILNAYKEDLIGYRTIGILFKNRIIDREFLSKIDVNPKDLISREFKNIDDKELSRLAITGIINSEELESIFGAKRIISIYKNNKNHNKKILKCLSKETIMRRYMLGDLTIKEYDSLNIRVMDVLKNKNAKNPILENELLILYKKIKNENISESYKKEILRKMPTEEELIELYLKGEFLKGKSMLELYEIGVLSIESIFKVYEIQKEYSSNDDRKISDEEIQKSITIDKIYDLYKQSRLSDESLNLYGKHIINLENREEIAQELTNKLKVDNELNFDSYIIFKNAGIFTIQESKNLEESEIEKIIEDTRITPVEVVELYKNGIIDETTLVLLPEEDKERRMKIQTAVLSKIENGEIDIEQGKSLLKEYKDLNHEEILETFIKASKYGIFQTSIPFALVYETEIVSEKSMKLQLKLGNINKEEILKDCRLGIFSEEKIVYMYFLELITTKDFGKLKSEGIVSEKRYIEILKSLTPEQCLAISNRENNAGIERNDATNEEGDGSGFEKGSSGEKELIEKNIIHPLKREELLLALGAEKYEDRDNLTKEDKYWILKRPGVIISEKYYSLSKEKKRFSYGEATIINSEENARDLIVNKDGKRVMHRVNSWATHLVEGILEKSNKTSLEEIYSPDEIEEIKNLQEELNSGKYTIVETVEIDREV